MLYDSALRSFLTKKPQPSLIAIPAVMTWIAERKLFGPRPEAVSVGEDRYLDYIEDGRVTVEYILVRDDREQLIVVKAFE